MSAKIKSGDDVIVLTGRDKGKIGKVIKVVACDAKKKVIVSGVNVHKRHTKPKAGSSGGILNKELAIDISNVATLDPKYKTPTRVGFKVIDGRKVRFAKISGEVIDQVDMFKELYKDSIVKSLKDKFNYSNIMQVPKLVKVCINMGVGDAATDKAINEPLDSLYLIAGQKPLSTFAKKSISGFKIRKGATVGCKVTLRRDKMYEFLERLIYIALPREKDFRGFSVKQFDGNGNFSFGIKEHISFLEIDYDKISKIRGMDINIITSAVSDKEAKELLLALKFPFFD